MAVPTLPLPNEDQLDLTTSVVSQTEGNLRCSNAKAFLRLNNAEISTIVATIPFDKLNKLYQEANVHCTPAKDCVTALRQYYGAVSGEESTDFKVFYQALFLAFDSVEPESGDRIYRVTEEGNLYSFNGSKFDLETEANLTAAQNLFMGELTLKHTPASANFEAFVSGQDVKSLILPFQTIFALLNDNGKDTFQLKSCAEIVSATADGVVKQSLILDTIAGSGSGLFTGKFANRQHNNPPYSDLIPFQVI